MNVRHYAPLFDDAVYHLWTLVGVPYSSMLELHGVHTVTAEAKTRFLHELTAGDLVVIDGGVIRLGNKSTVFQLRMHHADRGDLHATCDVVEVFFDPETRRSSEMPQAIRERLASILIDD